eukprot:4502380-Pyramimonas_sp.AAC.1
MAPWCKFKGHLISTGTSRALKCSSFSLSLFTNEITSRAFGEVVAKPKMCALALPSKSPRAIQHKWRCKMLTNWVSVGIGTTAAGTSGERQNTGGVHRAQAAHAAAGGGAQEAGAPHGDGADQEREGPGHPQPGTVQARGARPVGNRKRLLRSKGGWSAASWLVGTASRPDKNIHEANKKVKRRK